jgi:hypothetical protein
MSVRDDILVTTEAFHSCISDGEQAVVERLVELGYTPLHAEILLVFVPLGLARSIISRLPAKPAIKLPDHALVRDTNSNELRVPLQAVPEFTVAREMGEKNFTTGLISREQLEASCGSVEMNLVNQLLTKRVDIGGAEISASILLRLAAAPGFEAWYREVVSQNSTGFVPPNKRLQRTRQ